ncbi:cilia- and flagella-associated protein 90 isoform X1 [Dendropsophus ebraccatus]|uniref:cilia- and flagella-associated protein 90 isoform X1 n=1 Tax=Dendropsophus ebraccatus TaxID=150705 RepID=UPI003831737E
MLVEEICCARFIVAASPRRNSGERRQYTGGYRAVQEEAHPHTARQETGEEDYEEHISAYDSIFKRSQSYNEKLHRDDRKYAKHNSLDLYTEEAARPVPVLSSSEYGRHIQHNVDNVNREHVRIGLVRLDFYRKNGISKSLEEGYGRVVPS